MFVPPPFGGGERFFSDGGGDPTPGGIEAVGGSSVPLQGLLHTWEQEEVHRCQIQRIEQLLPGLDGDGGEPNSDYSSRVNSRFIPVENVALPSQPIGLFCLNLLKKILSSKCHDCKKTHLSQLAPHYRR